MRNREITTVASPLRDKEGTVVPNHAVVRYWPELGGERQEFYWCEWMDEHGRWAFFGVADHVPTPLTPEDIAERGERVEGLEESVRALLDQWRRQPHSHPDLSGVCWLAPAEHPPA